MCFYWIHSNLYDAFTFYNLKSLFFLFFSLAYSFDELQKLNLEVRIFIAIFKYKRNEKQTFMGESSVIIFNDTIVTEVFHAMNSGLLVRN